MLTPKVVACPDWKNPTSHVVFATVGTVSVTLVAVAAPTPTLASGCPDCFAPVNVATAIEPKAAPVKVTVTVLAPVAGAIIYQS